MFVEVDDGLVTPQALVLFETNLIVLLCVVRRALSANFDYSVGGKRRIAEFPRQGPRLITNLQDGLAGILSHALLLVPILGMGVDLLPGVVGALAGVAASHCEIHHDHAVLVIIGIDGFAVAQDVVTRRSLLHRSCLVGAAGIARLFVGDILAATRKAKAQGKRARPRQRAERAARERVPSHLLCRHRFSSFDSRRAHRRESGPDSSGGTIACRPSRKYGRCLVYHSRRPYAIR